MSPGTRKFPTAFASIGCGGWLENYHKADEARRGGSRVIEDGEDPFRMLLQVVWPDHDWAESAMLARLTGCPKCSAGRSWTSAETRDS